MEIRELETNGYNLFHVIQYFDGIPDVDKYWLEFCMLYGDHVLLKSIENLFLVDGLMVIGSIFDLKTNDWLKKEELSKLLNEPLDALEKTQETKKGVTSSMGTTTRSDTTDDADNYVSFDDIDTKTDSRSKQTHEEINNESENDDEYTLTKTKSGYDAKYYDFIMKTFSNDINYRQKIYSDIVGMLCLQIY